MDYKEETMKAYNTATDAFQNRFERDLQEIIPFLERFLSFLPHNSKILDAGCGPGVHAEYLQSHGHDVLCIDLSEEMVKRCKDKGLNAEQMDLEDLSFSSETFDGVFACTSLLHLPKKNIPAVIEKISSILKPDGIFAIRMKEGEGEGYDLSGEAKRFFSLFTDEELRGYFRDFFEIKSFERTRFDDRIFLSYILRKKLS